MAKAKLLTRLRRTLSSVTVLIEELSLLPPAEFEELLLGADDEVKKLHAVIDRALSMEELIVGVKDVDDR